MLVLSLLTTTSSFLSLLLKRGGEVVTTLVGVPKVFVGDGACFVRCVKTRGE